MRTTIATLTSLNAADEAKIQALSDYIYEQQINRFPHLSEAELNRATLCDWPDRTATEHEWYDAYTHGVSVDEFINSKRENMQKVLTP